jgi:thymidylate synthase
MDKSNSVLILEDSYSKILQRANIAGVYRRDRTGVGCKSLFNQSLSWDMSTNYFPMLTGRKMYQKVFKTEFEWFLNGETNIRRFQDAGVKIWDSWADENGDLGPVYGHQMLNFNNQSVNQLEAVIDSLKYNPDSRRHIISLWNPAQINEMALPPCYLYFQFFVNHHGYLDMFVVQRSADLFLGIPYDIALFSQMLLYISEQTGLSPGSVDLQMVDAHVYSNQIDAVYEYSKQDLYRPPTFTYKDSELIINNYVSGPRITAPVAV